MAPHGSYTPPQELSKDYIAEHRVQQMFSSLLSALMMHKPENPVDFIQNTLDEAKMVGLENVNWETFVYDLHPYRDQTRLSLIRDNSMYQQEHKRKQESAASGEESTGYKPDVFKLTEARPTPTQSAKSERQE